MEATKTCKIDTGDFVGSAFRGPKWTPYASAIAAHYPIQVPWYLTKRQTLTLAVSASLQTPVTQITQPQLYDSLIFGMSVLISGAVADDNGNFIFLNITDLQTGIPWVAPNMLGYAPVLAFAGANADPVTGALFPMPATKLPEAYFLPKGTRLKLDWYPMTVLGGINLTATLTMIGVQLINHTSGFRAPSHVTMPNGDVIPVGGRVPWFGCVPFGRRQPNPGSRVISNFDLPPGQQCVQFLPPINCNVELHDCYSNFTAQTVTPATNKTDFRIKLADMRSSGDWTPELSPAPVVFGNEEQVFPQLPFIMPHLLKTGHRTAMVLQNNSALVTLSQGVATLRGVRLCEY